MAERAEWSKAPDVERTDVRVEQGAKLRHVWSEMLLEANVLNPLRPRH